MVEPAVLPDGVPACLSSVTLGVGVRNVSVESVAVTEPPEGGSAEAIAELATWPASTSTCVTV